MSLEITSSTAAKDAMRKQWDQQANGWSDSSAIIRPWLRQATRAMIGMAGINAGADVIDIAAGAGDQTIDILERVRSDGSVLATDISPEGLRFAAQRASDAGHRNLETRVCDGENLQVDDSRFDAAVCRLGLMFFGDPLQGLREMLRVIKPGGGVCTMVFSTPQANPCVAILMATVLKHAGLPPRDPYQTGGLLSLGKPGLIDELFWKAGFSQIATTKVTAPFKLPGVQNYLDFIKSSAAPIIGILERLEAQKREAAWAEIEDQLKQFDTGAGWEGPNELLLTAARR